ncbi:MAG: DeoR/GlpR transcriptional regulator [Lawsonibacter sp.]|nr:DeoR/GlpR transcriptional regulator [Lawsonibacter sp.]
MDKFHPMCIPIEAELGHVGVETNCKEAEIKRLMVSKCRKVVLLVDHTKFDRSAFAKVLDLEAVNVVITDQKPASPWIERFFAMNIELIYPEMLDSPSPAGGPAKLL